MAPPRRGLALGIIAACAAGSGAVQMPTLAERIASGECSSDPPSQVGTYFPMNVQASSTYETAQLFDIVYHDRFKVVISHVAKEQYVLTQCGQTQPTTAEVNTAAPLQSGYQRKSFSIPLQSAAAGATVHLAFLDALGVNDRIRYVDSSAVGACWQKGLSCGAKLEDSRAGNATLRAEQIQSVDVFFMNCDWAGDAEDNCVGVRAQANAVHVPSAQDPSPMKTAEYVKFFAAFFNKEPEAIQYFSSVNASYNAIGKPANEPKPVVAWIQWLEWSMAYEVSMASYKTLMVTDAGGANFDAETKLAGLAGLERAEAASGVTYSIKIDAYNTSEADPSFAAVQARAAAALMPLLADVDVIIDETYVYDTRNYDLNAFKSNFHLTGAEDYAFLTSERVARFDSTVGAPPALGWDWYESRLARPDHAVRGLARMLWPANSYERWYFRNIGVGETVQLIYPTDCQKTLPVCVSTVAPETIKNLNKAATPVNEAKRCAGVESLWALAPAMAAAAAGRGL